jgi:hypothetical protein
MSSGTTPTANEPLQARPGPSRPAGGPAGSGAWPWGRSTRVPLGAQMSLVAPVEVHTNTTLGFGLAVCWGEPNHAAEGLAVEHDRRGVGHGRRQRGWTDHRPSPSSLTATHIR